MEVIPTNIPGVLIIKPGIFHDERGYFFESYSQQHFNEAVGREITFVQDNESSSSEGVVRGLHFQRPPHAQAKLVRVVQGRVLDVAVDLRHGSLTYGRHVAVELSAENHLQLFIPRGFAHGFAVLSPKATFIYKCDNYYAPQSEGGIFCLDPQLNIDWCLDPQSIILSHKDERHPTLSTLSPIFSMEGEAL